jgi:hypothetical protein
VTAIIGLLIWKHPEKRAQSAFSFGSGRIAQLSRWRGQ